MQPVVQCHACLIRYFDVTAETHIIVTQHGCHGMKLHVDRHICHFFDKEAIKSVSIDLCPLNALLLSRCAMTPARYHYLEQTISLSIRPSLLAIGTVRTTRNRNPTLSLYRYSIFGARLSPTPCHRIVVERMSYS